MKNLFERKKTKVSSLQSSERLAYQRESQALRVELEARDETIQRLKQETERLRWQLEDTVKTITTGQLEEIFTDLASPAAQLLTQADLLLNQEKPVTAQDILAVSMRLMRSLERHGFTIEGQVGEQTTFDPNLHQTLNAAVALAEGQAVTIRFVGISFNGKLIKRAFVDPQGVGTA